jgi:SnoaL-like domain
VSSYNEIANLYAEYAFRIDAGDMDGVARLFTHGRWVLSSDGEEYLAVGFDGVRKEFGNILLYGDGTPRTHHVISNLHIVANEADGTATGRAYVTCMQQVEEDDFPLQPICTAIYVDTFIRIDGKWWFDVRRATQIRIRDFSRHLTSTQIAAKFSGQAT